MSRGGTGMRSLGESLLIVGKGDDSLEAVQDVELDGGVLSIRGSLQLNTPDNQTVRLSSELMDVHGRPALYLRKPDGEKVDITRVRSSLVPVIHEITQAIAQAPAGQAAHTMRTAFMCYVLVSLVVSVYENAQQGTKTPYEILESYMAYRREATDLDGRGAVQQGYIRPERATSWKRRSSCRPASAECCVAS